MSRSSRNNAAVLRELAGLVGMSRRVARSGNGGAAVRELVPAWLALRWSAGGGKGAAAVRCRAAPRRVGEQRCDRVPAGRLRRHVAPRCSFGERRRGRARAGAGLAGLSRGVARSGSGAAGHVLAGRPATPARRSESLVRGNGAAAVRELVPAWPACRAGPGRRGDSATASESWAGFAGLPRRGLSSGNGAAAVRLLAGFSGTSCRAARSGNSAAAPRLLASRLRRRVARRGNGAAGRVLAARLRRHSAPVPVAGRQCYGPPRAGPASPAGWRRLRPAATTAHRSWPVAALAAVPGPAATTSPFGA